MDATSTSTRRTGRRPGRSHAREDILRAARASFAAHGYEGTTIRGVARGADVDPALVHHYFGTKDALFATALELPLNPAEVVPELFSSGTEDVGERLVSFFLSRWDSPTFRQPLEALVRSAASHEEAAAMLREFIGGEVLSAVAGAIDGEDAPLRAALVFSQMAGLAVARYGLRVEPLASAEPEVLVAAVAPTVQRYATGDLLPSEGARPSARSG